MKASVFALSWVLCISCQPVTHSNGLTKDTSKLNRLGWLIGKWQMNTADGTVIEEWRRPSDTQWNATSYMISYKGDTPFKERIRLQYTDDKLYYLPIISNQDEGKEISFAEKSFSDSLVVFENMNLDFPQRIIYKKISDTSILAAIEGVQNGRNYREEFAYKKQ